MKAINAVAERMMNGATLELTEAEGEKKGEKKRENKQKSGRLLYNVQSVLLTSSQARDRCPHRSFFMTPGSTRQTLARKVSFPFDLVLFIYFVLFHVSFFFTV